VSKRSRNCIASWIKEAAGEKQIEMNLSGEPVLANYKPSIDFTSIFGFFFLKSSCSNAIATLYNSFDGNDGFFAAAIARNGSNSFSAETHG
jgi:hypothetical protein